MYRFLALVWNRQDDEQAAIASLLGQRIESTWAGWSLVTQLDGMVIFHSGVVGRQDGYYTLAPGEGMVLGTLFRQGRSADTPETVLDDRACARIVATEGRYLVKNYWGRYVALVRPPGRRTLCVIRDPSGAAPCFVTIPGRMQVVFSHVEDCARLGLLRPGINWKHIVAYLWFDHLVASHTGLDSVRQVQAGECVTIRDRGFAAEYYWNPTSVCDKRTIDSRAEAMTELREVVQQCVSAWTSCYRTVLHELSGGLDSSIVLACLTRSPGRPTIICENHYTRETGGDERRFARQAATHAGVELIETPVQVGDGPLPGNFNVERVVSPAHSILVPETQERREAIVKLHGIEAVFSGQGGDHFFQSVRTRQIAAEYAWRVGLRSELLQVVADTSRLTGEPVLATIATVVTSGLLRKSPDPYRLIAPSPLLSASTREDRDWSMIRHPWVDLARRLPGAKRRQIFDVIDTQNFYRLPCHYADIVHPLMSQPLIELCLQIPSYVLAYNGIDRALARDAFRELLPSEITARTSKGSTTGYFNRRIVRSLPLLRELLLDGRLVEERILDRKQMHIALSESSLVRRADLLFAIVAAATAESWVRSWGTERNKAAA